jgi:hypothetical protein
VLTLADMQGRAVARPRAVDGAVSTPIDVSGLPAGAYVLRLRQANGTVQSRLVTVVR